MVEALLFKGGFFLVYFAIFEKRNIPSNELRLHLFARDPGIETDRN